MSHYRQFHLSEDKFRRLHDWYDACLRVPGFANTLVDEPTLVESYVGYANNTADSNASQVYRQQK